MPNASETTHSARRPLRSFWLLTVVAIAAAGSLGAALAAHPGALTGVRVALSGLVLAAAVTLAARVMVFHELARRRSRG
ncbi:hypothetical protein CFI00_08790 [Nocardioides sp. S5]|jgi:amino acid transporter|nr:hypothetical protein CFI00_08790 [Nocardioides sp. S5]